MRTSLRSSPVFLVGALLTAACTAMRPVDRAELSPPNALTRVWVTRARATVVFDSARVSGDSLVGIANGERRQLQLSDVTSLGVREHSEIRTAGFAFAVGGAVATVIMYAEAHGWLDGAPQGSCDGVCHRVDAGAAGAGP